ncbi:MAG TPA: hypothetical protein ENN69_05075, partial [Spirochaetia bacterium]|nr:hypothetical protein [Spirochaetia bacterium]
MNRQRLLWVILSLTLLVIVILIGGLWLLRTPETVPVTEINREPLTQFDVFEITNGTARLPGIDRTEGSVTEQDMVIGEAEASPSPLPSP